MIYYPESLLCVYYYHYHYLTVIANYLLFVYYRIIPFSIVFQHLHRVYPTFFQLHLYASIIFSVGSLLNTTIMKCESSERVKAGSMQALAAHVTGSHSTT